MDINSLLCYIVAGVGMFIVGYVLAKSSSSQKKEKDELDKYKPDESSVKERLDELEKGQRTLDDNISCKLDSKTFYFLRVIKPEELILKEAKKDRIVVQDYIDGTKVDVGYLYKVTKYSTYTYLTPSYEVIRFVPNVMLEDSNKYEEYKDEIADYFDKDYVYAKFREQK